MEKETNIPQVGDLERVLVDEGAPSERWEWRIKGTLTHHHPTEPAIEWKDGDWGWFSMDMIHRLDGPAMFWAGEYEYWIMCEKLSKDEWETHPDRLEWLRTNKLEGI